MELKNKFLIKVFTFVFVFMSTTVVFSQTLNGPEVIESGGSAGYWFEEWSDYQVVDGSWTIRYLDTQTSAGIGTAVAPYAGEIEPHTFYVINRKAIITGTFLQSNDNYVEVTKQVTILGENPFNLSNLSPDYGETTVTSLLIGTQLPNTHTTTWSLVGGSTIMSSSNSSVEINWNTVGEHTLTASVLYDGITFTVSKVIDVQPTYRKLPLIIGNVVVELNTPTKYDIKTELPEEVSTTWNVTGGLIIAQDNAGVIINWTNNEGGILTASVDFNDGLDPYSAELEVTAPSVTSPYGGTISTNENYIKTAIYQEPTQSEQNTTAKRIETITYVDALGRPKQQVSLEAGGNKEHIIRHIEYDVFGRQTKEFLPYASTSSTNAFRTQAANEVNTFYNTTKYENTTNPYSETQFDGITFNRVIKQSAPGADWDAHILEEHTIRTKYDIVKNEDNVRTLGVSYNGNGVPSLITTEDGVGITLYKQISKNENWKRSDGKNNTTEAYTDYQNRTLLKRAYNEGVSHDTYYVYDDYENLVFVIPPKVTFPVSNDELSELCYQYIYDDRNRLVEKKIPGKGWEYIVYDKLDRPILTQDAIQHAKPNKEWLFTKYDNFGRVVYTGLYKDNNSRETLQGLANSSSQVNEVIGNGGLFYYTNNVFPTNIPYYDVYTINYYDDYVYWNGDTQNPNQNIYGEALMPNAKGLPTTSKVKVLGVSDAWVTTISGYDDKYQPIYVYSSNNYLNTTDIFESKLEFDSTVTETTSSHSKTGHNPIITIDKYKYDHVNRLLSHKQNVNNAVIDEVIVSNTYDELGGLESKAVGGSCSINAYEDIVNLKVTDRTIIRNTKHSGWNAGLATTGEISNNGFIEYEIPQTNKAIMVGLSNTNTNANFNTIKYAIYTASNQRLYVWESGIWRGDFGNYFAGDKFKVERIGKTIQYKRNGEVFYTSTIDSLGVLIGDISIYTSHGSIKNLKVNSQLKDIVNLKVTDRIITKDINSSDWDAGLATTSEISNDGYIEYEIPQTNKAIMVGLSNTNTNANFNTIKYAIYTASNQRLYVYEFGNWKGEFGNYFAGDKFKVERIGTSIYYKKNGEVFYTSTSPSSGVLIGDMSIYTYQGAVENLTIQCSGLQNVDYTYNIRGWLKTINNPDNLDDDLFGFQINYNTTQLSSSANGSNLTTPLYNGNISETIWKTKNDEINAPNGVNPNDFKRGYSYSYDDLNRITTAWNMQLDADVNINTGGGGFLDYSLHGVSYDKNGNILTLRRKANHGYYSIDDLAYTYDSGNKLLKVDDNASVSYKDEGFKDGGNSGDDYTYDINGNVYSDNNKGIVDIYYNHLNLPTYLEVESTDEGNITYIYDATGVKLRKIALTNFESITTTTDYAGNYVYENDELKFFSQPEGYVEPNNNNGFDYVYQYKDHLGNIRLSYSDSDGNGSIDASTEIIEENNYYPFGLEHDVYNNVISANSNSAASKRKFQGQELEKELGKNTYAYQQRDYDPTIGRFNKIDRFAEKYRSDNPYHFTLNNPILFKEIKGDSVWFYNESIKQLGGMATHAFLRVKTDKVDVTIELTGQIEGKKTGKPAKKDFKPKWFTYKRGSVGDATLVEPNGENEDYEFENSILESFEMFEEKDGDGNYKNLPDYSALGPNSNGFVKSLVKNAKGGVVLNLGIRGVGQNNTAAYDTAIKENLLKKTREAVEANKEAIKRLNELLKKLQEDKL